MEHIDFGKSANQIWKESGSTLSFKDWLQREKDKGRFLPNKTLSEFNSIEGDVATLNVNADVITEKKSKSKVVSKNYYFDVAKIAVIVAVGFIIGGFAFNYYKKK